MASWASMARARSSTSSPVPVTSTRANERSDIATGRSGDRGVGADEVPQGRGGDRVEVLQRRGLRRAQRSGQPLRAGADADPAEVRSSRRRSHSRPRSTKPTGRPVRAARPISAIRCCSGDLPHLAAQAGQIALVVAPLVVDLRLLGHPAAGQRHDDHADHGRREQRAEDVGHDAAAAADVDERHRAHAEHHRQEEHQLHRALVGALGQQRRGLQRDLAARRLQRRPPGLRSTHNGILPRKEGAACGYFYRQREESARPRRCLEWLAGFRSPPPDVRHHLGRCGGRNLASEGTGFERPSPARNARQ